MPPSIFHLVVFSPVENGHVGATQVEKLLKHGAYDVFKEGDGDAGKKFCEDSIDAILSRAKV